MKKTNRLRYREIKSHIFLGVLSFSSLFIIVPLFLLLIFLFTKGIKGFNWEFLTTLPKGPTEAGGGVAHAIIGTLWVVALGSLISVPLGVLSGTFLSEFSKDKLAPILRYCADLMTGIPSIVVGIFSYALLVVPLKSFSALAGGVALSIIMLPVITRATEEILKLTPDDIRKSALALGLPRWKLIFFIIIKANRGAILTGIILAISRAAGETAPLLFTAFGNMYYSYTWKEPIATLPVQIYNYAISPSEFWQQKAWSAALLLIIIILCMNLISRIISGRINFSLIFIQLRKKWIKK